jgi:hypothetical protein
MIAVGIDHCKLFFFFFSSFRDCWECSNQFL